MKVRVDLTGLARSIVGSKPVWLDIPENGTYRDVVASLSSQFPALVGVVISPDSRDLLNANIFSKNGEDLILDEGMQGHPEEGEKLLLLSVIVGGKLNA